MENKQKKHTLKSTIGNHAKVSTFSLSRHCVVKYYGPLVQWSERPAHNGIVVGSNPTGPTIKGNNIDISIFTMWMV